MSPDSNSFNPFQLPASPPTSPPPAPIPPPKKPLYRRVLFGCLWSVLGFIAFIAVVGSIIGSSPSSDSSPTPVTVAVVPTQSPAEIAKAMAAESKRKAQEKVRLAQEQKRQREVAEQESKEQKRRSEAGKLALSKLRSNKDEVEEITWYEHRNTPKFVNSRSSMWLYFGKTKTSVTPLRMKISYVADDWLFIEKYIFKIGDQTQTVEADYSDVKRDNSGGEIWEWYDQPVSDENLAMIRDIIDSDRTILRYEGQQYRKDRDITSREKQAMKDVIVAHAAAEEAL